MILFWTIDANPIIIAKIIVAPRKAPKTIAIELDKSKEAALPITPPNNKMTIATPKLAPALIPNIPGSANGLRKAVWRSRPDTDSAPPVNKAVMDWGRRTSRIICSHVFLVAPFPDNILMISEKGMLTAPKKRFASNRIIIPVIRIVRYLNVLLFKS